MNMAPAPHKILIVDDEPLFKTIILQRFKLQVKNQELSFIFASNGAEALEKFEQDKEIGVILTDIKMPVMDGLELLAKLNQQSRPYRAVVVSAYNDLANIRIAMNRGAIDFITKPVNLNDLEITIKKTIDQFETLKHGLLNQKQIVEYQKELNIAREIQQTFIPHHFDPFPGNNNVNLLGEMRPAEEVGGDFFDFFPINDHCLALVMADVSGKGVPAALFMAMSRVLIRATAITTESPMACLRQVNHVLCTDDGSSMFVTAFYAILDINTGVFKYCNAGHNPPYVLSPNNGIQQIGRAEGVALGVADDLGMENSQYEEKEIILYKDDSVFFYTDGVTEAINPLRELFGEHKLEEILKKSTKETLPNLIKSVTDEVKAFEQGAKQTDDMTILCLRFCKHG